MHRLAPLQIFPKHPDADAYYVNGSYTPWAVVGRDKRFTDAELAAEYHHMGRVRGTAYIHRAMLNEPERSKFAEELRLEHETISRFARLPHFDE